MRRGWHHIIVRCGPNTTKDFMEQSEPGVVLGENDIFFVDIGPIYGDTEGDAGDTFVFGDDPDHLRAKTEVRQIWDDVRDTWFDRGHHRQGALRLRHRDGRRLRLEAEHGPLGPPPLGLPALGALRRTAGRGRRSGPTRTCGCSRSPSPTPSGRSAPSTRTSCSRTSPSRGTDVAGVAARPTRAVTSQNPRHFAPWCVEGCPLPRRALTTTHRPSRPPTHVAAQRPSAPASDPRSTAQPSITLTRRPAPKKECTMTHDLDRRHQRHPSPGPRAGPPTERAGFPDPVRPVGRR